MSYVVFESVRKQYPGRDEEALKGIDLSIEPGEFLGLLGPNGCGKTTLLSILCHLIPASQGQVYVAGKNALKQSKALRHIMGLVPQDLALYPTLTFRENLEFYGHLYGLTGQRLKDRINACIEVAKLETFQHKLVESYSGGMKRRANLAISLLHEPQLLLLDEPTVNVDPQSRQVIFEILQKLNQEGVTMIYTTHYLEEAQLLCDRVAIMDKGKILVTGTPASLIEQTPGAEDLGQVFMTLTGKHLRD